MTTLTGFLCCVWKGLAGSSRGGTSPGKPAEANRTEDNPGDDLMVFHGIGIATQNRLYAAGIKTFAQLARATPEEVRMILGNLTRGAKVEDWIKEAGDRAARSAATKS